MANALLDENQLDAPEKSWPLELVRCEECSLVQITETVPPDELFRDYAYFSSFSETMVDHAKQLVDRMVDEHKLNADDLAVEIASNDGYLLQWYKEQGVPVVGIEPAENIAKVAREERGIETVCEFFGASLAEELSQQGKQASVLHANNVLAHVADLPGFVTGCKTLLRPDGLFIAEFPYLGDLIQNTEFDTIYHEHLCYFSLMAVDRLFARVGLRVTDVERLSIHGGSLRVFAKPQMDLEPSQAVKDLLEQELDWVFDEATYTDFAERVHALRDALVSRLKELKRTGKQIAVYGASAKGSTLLNFFGIGSDLIDFVVDRSDVKQGRYTPGTRLKIFSPDHLVEKQPDYCLLLTWNFAKEILRQQQAYRDNGGKFIIPIPEVLVA